MNYLRNKRIYLSGPIEYCDSKTDWRPAIKEVLENRFQLNIFDPFSDPKQSKADKLKAAKEKEDYKTVRKIVKKFVRKDLANVDGSHFLVAHLPPGVPTFGTVHEIINANNSKKPVLLVCQKGVQQIPSWFFGFIKRKYMFGSWEHLYNYLEEVDNGLHIDDDRWWLVNEVI